MPSAVPTPSTRAYVGAFIALALLAAGTTALNRAYKQARAARAESAYEEGRRLAASGSGEAAVERYREALGLARNNQQYTLALALALLDAGRYAEADKYLQHLLAEQPTDALANRAMARVDARLGRIEAATTHYNRAIYGYWRTRAREERLATRFELVALLQRIGARQELLAALLEIEAELNPDDTAGHIRVAEAYVAAGAVEDAVALLTRFAEAHPNDAAAWRRLGYLELGRKQFAGATRALRRAAALDRDDAGAREGLARANRALALDPTLPGLRSAERRRRERALLDTALEVVWSCAFAPPPAPLAALLDEARAAGRPRRRGEPDERDAGELAVRIWDAAMQAGCTPRGPGAVAFADVLPHLRAEGTP